MSFTYWIQLLGVEFYAFHSYSGCVAMRLTHLHFSCSDICGASVCHFIWRMFETKTLAINSKVHNVCRYGCKYLNLVCSWFCIVYDWDGVHEWYEAYYKLWFIRVFELLDVRNAVDSSKMVSLNHTEGVLIIFLVNKICIRYFPNLG